MNKFKDLGIENDYSGFIGEKIKIEDVFNKNIKVHKYDIKDSKKKMNTKCLYLQISIQGTMRVLFTGSSSLMNTIEKISKDKFPFETTIVKKEQRFLFT